LRGIGRIEEYSPFRNWISDILISDFCQFSDSKMSGSTKRSRAAMEGGTDSSSGHNGEASPVGFVRLHSKPGSGAFLDPVGGEEIKLTVPGLKLHVGTFDAGTGTLFVTTE
jgi:hypothetical protein